MSRSLSPWGFTPEDTTVPTNLVDVSSLGRSPGTADGVPPQGGIFERCLAFLKYVGVGLVMSPYTIGDGPSHGIARKRGYKNWVGSRSSTRSSCVVADLFIQSVTAVTELPLV